MDGKENQDPTSTTEDVSENSTTIEQQQQLSAEPRKSLSPQEYIRQKQNEKETTTTTERKSWFFDLNDEEKPHDPVLPARLGESHSSLDHHLPSATNRENEELKSTDEPISLNTQNVLSASLNLRHPNEKEATITTNSMSIPDSDSTHVNLRNSYQEKVIGAWETGISGSAKDSPQNVTIAQKQTPFQLLGQTTDQLRSEIYKEDSFAKTAQVSPILWSIFTLFVIAYNDLRFMLYNKRTEWEICVLPSSALLVDFTLLPWMVSVAATLCRSLCEG